MLLEFSFIVLLEALFYITGARRNFMKLFTLLSTAGVCGYILCGILYAGEETEIPFDLDCMEAAPALQKPKNCLANVCLPNNQFMDLALTDPETIIILLTQGSVHLQNALQSNLYYFSLHSA